MCSDSRSDTAELVRAAAGGSASATERLFGRHRDRLRRMIMVRLDDSILHRVDPSDVIQDTLTEAHRRLPDYLEAAPIPFYPWLRQLAARRLTDLHRRHIGASRRSVRREDPGLSISQDSLPGLAKRILARSPEPSAQVVEQEAVEAVAAAVSQLPDEGREVLILRHVEQLSVADTAAVLNLAEGTVKSRHYRALQRLRLILRGAGFGGDG